MAVESAADRAVFFSVDDFGVSATYTPVGGASVTIAGIFDNDFVALDTAGGVAVRCSNRDLHAERRRSQRRKKVTR